MDSVDVESPLVEDFLTEGEQGAGGEGGLLAQLPQIVHQNVQELCIRELLLVLGVVDSLAEHGAAASSRHSSEPSLFHSLSLSPSDGKVLPTPLPPTLPYPAQSFASQCFSHPISLLHPLAQEFVRDSDSNGAFLSHVLSRLLQRRFLTSAFANQWASSLRRFVTALFSFAARFHDVLLAESVDSGVGHQPESDSGKARNMARWLLSAPACHSSHAPELLLLRLLLCAAAIGSEVNGLDLELLGTDDDAEGMGGTLEGSASLAVLEQYRVASVGHIDAVLDTALSCLPSSLAEALLSPSSEPASAPVLAKRALLLCACYQLQLAVQLLDMAASHRLRGVVRGVGAGSSKAGGGRGRASSVDSNNSVGSEGEEEGASSANLDAGWGEEQAVFLDGMATSLEAVAVGESRLVPEMALVVKLGLALGCCVGGGGGRFDFLNLALRLQLKIDPIAVVHSAVGSSTGSTPPLPSSLPCFPWRAASQRSMLAELLRDSGYQHFHSLSRADAVAVLQHFAASEAKAGRHQGALGSFVVRPHDRHPDLLFLSFIPTTGGSEEGASAVAGASSTAPSVTHAIIRRVAIADLGSGPTSAASADGSRSPPTSSGGGGTFEYRCGKVGPYPSLTEMLAAISRVLPASAAPRTTASDKRQPQARKLALTSPVPLPPFTAVPLPSFRGSGTVAAAATLFGLASCDPNAALWEEAARCGLGHASHKLLFSGGSRRVAAVPTTPAGGQDSSSASPASPASCVKDPWSAPLEPRARQELAHAVALLLSVQMLQQECAVVIQALDTGTGGGAGSQQSRHKGSTPCTAPAIATALARRLGSLSAEASASLASLLTPFPPPTTSFIPWLAPPGIVAAERAMGHLLAAVPVQIVRLPGRGAGVGTAEYTAECIDPQEALAWLTERETRLQQWLDAQVKEGYARKQREAQSGGWAGGVLGAGGGEEGAAIQLSSSSSSSGNGNGGGTGGGESNKSSIGTGLHMIVMLKMAVAGWLQQQQSLSATRTGGGSSSSSSSPPDLTTYNAADWAAAHTAWLQESRCMYAVTKPADSAFQGSTVLFRYRDAWEGRVVGTEGRAGGLQDIEPVPGERFRLGRYCYVKPAVGDAIASIVWSGSAGTGGGGGGADAGAAAATASGHGTSANSSSDEGGWGRGFKHLWGAIRGDAWISELVAGASFGTAAPFRPMPPSAVRLTPAPAPTHSASAYEHSLQCHLHRNLLMSRLSLPLRFVSQVQCTLLGLKDVASVGGGAAGAASMLLQFVPPSTLEVYLVCSLVRVAPAAGGGGAAGLQSSTAAAAATSNGGSTNSSSTAAATAAAAAAGAKRGAGMGGGNATSVGSFAARIASMAGEVVSGRLPGDGTYTGPTRRAEIFKDDASASAKTGAAGLGGGSGIEYRVRDTATFRFPLPEGVVSVSPSGLGGGSSDTAASTSALQRAGSGGSGAGGAGVGVKTSSKAGRGFAQRAEEETWRGTQHSPPNALHVVIYERAFLSESRLGELLVPLGALTHTEGGAIEEWLPLITERNRGNGAWLAHVRVELKFLLMAIEGIPASAAAGTAHPQVAKGKSLNLPGFDVGSGNQMQL